MAKMNIQILAPVDHDPDGCQVSLQYVGESGLHQIKREGDFLLFAS